MTQQIKGYRKLTQPEIDMVNRIKELERNFNELIEFIKTENEELDTVWLDSGILDVKKGLMCVTRSITRPTI